MLGGGLLYSDFNGTGHRDILNHPGYGYSTGDDNSLFKGARPTTSSYNVSSCKGGAKKKKRKSIKKRRKKRKTRRRKSIKKRRRKSNKKRRRKSNKKRRQSGCGQKGGALTTYSFPGKFDSSLGDFRLAKGHGIEVNAYNNCFDNYNHNTRTNN
jgi:hypothetical protein